MLVAHHQHPRAAGQYLRQLRRMQQTFDGQVRYKQRNCQRLNDGCEATNRIRRAGGANRHRGRQLGRGQHHVERVGT